MAVFHGIIIYEILENGNLLNGVYTNTHKGSRKQPPPYDIDNEIARKKVCDDKGVIGEYASRYIETTPDPKVVTHCTLTIAKHDEVLQFDWSDENGIFYKGIGMRVGPSHIAVSYTNP
jgi:hypothetical protein